MIRKQVSFAAFAVSSAICSFVSAATIVDFKPGPISPTLPEFVFTRSLGGAPVFRGTSGAASNGDGTLPVAAQIQGGLDAETPFLIVGIGSLVKATSTEFYDTTLQFTSGLQANAPAQNFGGILTQQLSPGTFSLTGTTGQVLLTGNISNATFIVGAGDAGAVFNASGINYTGGLIYGAMIANGYIPNNNSMSISMTDIAPPLGIDGDGYLADFSANATGLFSAAVPEPTSLTLLAIATAALFLRRERPISIVHSR